MVGAANRNCSTRSSGQRAEIGSIVDEPPLAAAISPQVSATDVNTRLYAAIDFAPSTTPATKAAATSQKPRKREAKRSMAYR